MDAIRTAILAAFCAPGLAGCLDPGGDALTVATAWAAPDRARFADALRRDPTGPPVRVRWLTLAPGDDLRRVVLRRPAPDLVLGGPASAYRAIAARGLTETDGEGGASWWVARRSQPLHLADVRKQGAAAGPTVAFNDPRRDPASLARAEAVLASGPWAEGYARLVLEAAGPFPPGRQPGAALAAFERGEAASALGVIPGSDGAAGDWVEGVAVVRGSRHAERALRLLRGLADGDQVGPPPPPGAPPGAGPLAADLLGATVVDAHDELAAARSALDAAGRPDRPRQWMCQPPPWPPASVSKILGREENAMPLLETLAAEVAPEADARAWLVRSWLSPARPIDGALLGDLAGAAGGRLAREPRFRAWLRAEWTAWARQRYRRVARLARAVAGAPS